MTDVATTGHEAESWRGRLARRASVLFLVLWAVGSIVVGATLMVGHWYTLPAPSTEEPRLVRALGELCGTDREGWSAVHVLYAECRCSRRILDHLFESQRPDAVAEHLLLVGQAPELAKRMSAKGFAVETLQPAELKARFGIEAAPLLLVVDPRGTVRYGGGYSDRKQGPAIRDLEILADLVRGEDAGRYPVFGCGVSKELQALLDPIGLKYQ